MAHLGSRNFQVWLLDANSGEKLESLVNSIGEFEGSKAVSIKSDVQYMLDVNADGWWIITTVGD